MGRFRGKPSLYFYTYEKTPLDLPSDDSSGSYSLGS